MYENEIKVVSKHFTKLEPHQVDIEVLQFTKAEKKSCFKNCYKYTSENKNTKYVLGFMFFLGVIIEHAFIEKDGKYYEISTGTVANTFYYECVKLSYKELSEVVEYSGSAPDFYEYEKYLRNKSKSV
jgi:hypothetical protein